MRPSRSPNRVESQVLPTRTELRYEAMAAVGIAVLIYVAFRIVGFLGVGILGLAIAYVAVQADLNKDETSHVWAMRAEPARQMDHAERATRRAANDSLAHPILMGKLLGLSLAVIGLAAFLLL